MRRKTAREWSVREKDLVEHCALPGLLLHFGADDRILGLWRNCAAERVFVGTNADRPYFRRMKKNILDSEARAIMLGRIAQFKADSIAQWGKMNADQCICHLADQLRMLFGQVKVHGKPSFLGRNVLKNLVLMGMPAPKGKVPTAPEIDQQTAGTKPTNFEADRKRLLELLDQFVGTSESFVFQTHPFFGSMTKQQWGKLVWSHLDHHLSQFGA